MSTRFAPMHACTFWIWLVVIGLSSASALAQFRVTTPVARMVFQRDLSNQASVIVAGVAPSTATLIEARFVPLAVGQGSATNWTRLDLLTSNAFRGRIDVLAGWYRLDVRAKADETVLAETYVNRVGIGEVFVTAGQSNAFGGYERVAGAEEDRVSCVDFRQDSLSEQLLPLVFSHVSYGANIGPSQPPHLWGMLGDKLVRRLNVPVLFLGAALGGTSSSDWRNSADGNVGPTPTSAVYRRLGAVLLHYVARTGARAVLWHQGESDLSTSTQTYFDNISTVIARSRRQSGPGVLPWMVCRASYINNQTNGNVIAAQNRLIAELPAVFAGPNTDTIVGPENRPDGIHFKGIGMSRFLTSWDQALNDAFFATAVPVTPADESTLITSGYTLPLTRRPGETLAAASVRSDPASPATQYVAQLLRADTDQVVYESARSTANPLAITLPATLPDGQYRLRTQSSPPALTGTVGEPFRVQGSAPPTPTGSWLTQPGSGGTTDAAIQRFGYRYETGSHGFYAMVRASVPTEVRLERLDGGVFNDTNWNLTQPVSEAPDYGEFADFTHVRNYPPVAMAVGGVEPGRYRLSVRRQGDTGAGLWFETMVLDGRNILYYPMEPVGTLPPVLTLTTVPLPTTCLSGSFNVGFTVTESAVGAGNTFTVQLSNATGSFANATAIGSGANSPITAVAPANLPDGTNYRLRVAASNPAVQSAPSSPYTYCSASSSQADLSLAFQISSRTVAVHQPIACTLTLTNNGPATATGLVATSRLPVGLTFVDAASSGVSATNGILTVNVGTLSATTAQPVRFRLKATQSGTFAIATQITASQTPDPDSQPNSGTGDGQDDAASTSLRTTDGSGVLVASANPTQTALPGVQDNQPAPNPAQADLSVAISVSNRVSQRNGVIVVTLLVSNRGGASVGSATLHTLLPDGWQVTNTTGLTITGQTVTATLPSIDVNGSASVTFPVRVDGSGRLRTQLQSTNKTDPDSTPGNGYTNGEDDEASVSVRAR